MRNEKTYAAGEEGKAAYIQANCADVLLFLLDYVFNGLKDKTLLDAILAKLGGNANLPELVYSIIDRVLANPHKAIATLIELIIPQTYDEPNSVKWKEAAPPVNGAAALYNEYWTQAKADYMTANLPSLIDNALGMAGLNIAGISATSLPALLDGLVGMICKAELLNDLAGKIRELVGKVSLPAAVCELLKQKLGFDIHYWDSYHTDFADGDRAGFKTAVTNLLYPIQKVVNLLLMDEDIDIMLTSASGETIPFLHLHGFNGYSQALVPLLEALGAENLPSPDSFRSNREFAFHTIIDAIFGVIDSLKADPYNKITALLPNILTFIRFGGLTAIVDNLLYPVNLLLDTVRPIYSVDLYSLVKFDLRFVNTDPITLLMGLLSDMIEKELGVRIALNFTTESLYNALNTGTVETFTSVNGQTAYRVNEATINRADMLTVVYDYLLRELLFSENTPAYLSFAKDKLSLNDQVYGYIEKILPALKSADETYPGSGKALIFWVFYVGEAVVGAIGENGGTDDVLGLITKLVSSGSPEKRDFAKTEFKSDFAKPGFSNVLKSVLQALISK